MSNVVPLFEKKIKQEYLDVLGDYDPDNERVDELVEIHASVKKKIDHVTTILLQMANTLSRDMFGFETAKAKELIVSCYADLERIDLNGDPSDSRESYHEHLVFSRLAWFLIPLLIRLDASEEAKDLFRAVKIKKLRDGLEDKYWQLQYPFFDP
jgi:hypothetical protein